MLLVGIGVMLTLTSVPAFREFGVVGFITGTSWNPVKAVYGALPYIVGTLLSSGIALLISHPDRDPDRDLPGRAGARAASRSRSRSWSS